MSTKNHRGDINDTSSPPSVAGMYLCMWNPNNDFQTLQERIYICVARYGCKIRTESGTNRDLSGGRSRHYSEDQTRARGVVCKWS